MLIETYRILHVNLDNKAPSGTFTLLYSMLDYLPQSYIFDFLGDIEENDYLIKIRKNGGDAFNQPDSKNKLKKWKDIEQYTYELCKRNDYKVVHIASDSSFKAIKYARAARKAGVSKIIVHSHNSCLAGKLKQIKRIYHFIDKFILPSHCDVYAACSKEAARWMWPAKLLKDNKVDVVINGIDIERFICNSSNRESFRKKYTLENKFVIGHISDFGYQKNPEYILAIFEELYKKDKDCVLLLIGSKKFKEEILEKEKDKEHFKGIVDVGVLHDTENAYAAMDIYIQPSRYEGLPICMIEAAASGLKILGSRNISKEAIILDNTEFLSIEESPTLWAERILEYKRGMLSINQRIQKGNSLIGSVFDIQITTRRFLEMYRK